MRHPSTEESNYVGINDIASEELLRGKKNPGVKT